MKETVILIPAAPGELIDKITVLKIKREYISHPEKVANIERELSMLEEARKKHFPDTGELLGKIQELEDRLKKANETIWHMSEKIRELVDTKDFSKDFVEVSLKIHLSNDIRATIKKEINILLGSHIIEEKSYKHWK